ncbi:hypothetical protein PO124_24625 [Bacillus licheniformis]|nr:hypothetical protein [Bacillus licheniformis]
MNGMAMSLSGLHNQFSLAGSSLENLAKYRYVEVPEQQLGQISTIQSELISNYKADARQLNIKNIESQSHILEYRQNCSNLMTHR